MRQIYLQYLKLNVATTVVKTEYFMVYALPLCLKALVIKVLPTDDVTIVSIEFHKVQCFVHTQINSSVQHIRITQPILKIVRTT